MNWDLTLSEVRDLCYQCEFRQVVEAVDNIANQVRDEEEQFSLQLLKSQALFEMHKVSEAKNLLRDLASNQQNQSDTYLYVMAKLSYADKNYEKSERMFKLLADRSESVSGYFKALLGLANTYYSLRRYQDIKVLIPEIEELTDIVSVDEKLSFDLLKANSFYVADGWTSEAKKLFHNVIHVASQCKWNYFIIKSFYGLASVYKDQGQKEALAVTLDILKCYLKTDETAYLTYLVNEQFKDVNFSLSSSLQFDLEYKRICVQGKWIALHDKPLVYRFLEFLHGKGSFVSKKEIAEHLWVDQEYKFRTHDPRIFDLARRVRSMIEPYENQPVCLLSGRLGYKLTGPENSGNDQESEVEVKPKPKDRIEDFAYNEAFH